MSAPFEWADGYAVGILPFLYKPLTVRVWTVPWKIHPTTNVESYLLAHPDLDGLEPALEVLYTAGLHFDLVRVGSWSLPLREVIGTHPYHLRAAMFPVLVMPLFLWGDSLYQP